MPTTHQIYINKDKLNNKVKTLELKFKIIENKISLDEFKSDVS